MSLKGRLKNAPGFDLATLGRRSGGLLIVFGLLVVAGSIGYHIIEGWGWDDAVFMTVITLTAVGHEIVRPLSLNGERFTMILLLGGVTWLAGWFALITSFVVELDLANVFRRRRTMREIAGMKDHVIVCGAGRTGLQVVQELESFGARWVVIERDSKRIEELLTVIPDAYVIDGDATHDQTLIEAGVNQATGLVSCLSADTDNLFVCLSARALSPSVTIVARAYEEETMSKLYRSGADRVVSPNVSGAIRMASVLLRPSVVSFLDVATRSSNVSLRMEQAAVDRGSSLAGKSLAEAQIPSKTGLIVIAVQKGDTQNEFVFNPVADTVLEEGDEVIVLGQPGQIDRLRAYTGG